MNEYLRSDGALMRKVAPDHFVVGTAKPREYISPCVSDGSDYEAIYADPAAGGRPTKFREIYNAWALTAPPNDSDIFGDKPKMSERPRHRENALAWAPLLWWRDIHRAAEGKTSEWLANAADNNGRGEGWDDEKPTRYDVLRTLECRPRPEEIIAALKGVVWDPITGRILGGDIAYEDRVLVRAGNLRFSTGEGRQYWAKWCGNKILRDERVGALVGWRNSPKAKSWQGITYDQPGRAYGLSKKGRDKEEGDCRDHLLQLLGFPHALSWEHHAYVATISAHQPVVVSYPTNELREELKALGINGSVSLNEARARHRLPPAKKDLYPALPTKDPWGGFLGMRATCQATPPLTEDTIEDRIIARSQIERAKEILTAQELLLLEKARFAGSFQALGEAVGLGNGKHAAREAKKLLTDTCNKLSESLFSDSCGYIVGEVSLSPPPLSQRLFTSRRLDPTNRRREAFSRGLETAF